ncbi:MAG: gas vesicle protein [Pseudomonadota bacterium]
MTLEMQLAEPADALASSDSRLVDVVDGLLHHGVVIHGELWLTVGDVELVFLGLHLVLASPDTIRAAGAP